MRVLAMPIAETAAVTALRCDSFVMSNDWTALTSKDQTERIVVPIGDSRGHETFSHNCWCKPYFDKNPEGHDVMVHNAHDRREMYQLGFSQVS